MTFTPQSIYEDQPEPAPTEDPIEAVQRPEHPRVQSDHLDQQQALLALATLRETAAGVVLGYVVNGDGVDFRDELRQLADTVREVDRVLYPAPPPDAPEQAEVFYARALEPHDRVFLEDKGGWVLVTKSEQGRTAVTLHLDGCHGRDIHQTHTLNADTPVVTWRGR